MSEYKVVTYESELHTYTYYIEASSPEEAGELVRAGGVDYARHKWISGEIESVEVSNMPRGKEVIPRGDEGRTEEA